MLKKVILFSYIFSLSFSQAIDHQPEKLVYSNIPLQIEVFSDYNKSDISSFSIFYKSNNQDIYIQNQLNPLSENTYSFIIQPEFLLGQYIEYYFLMELNDNSFISFPKLEPHNMPISIRIENVLPTEYIHKSYLDADFNIISPLPGEDVLDEDLIVSVSYFRMKNLNLDAVKVFIDDKDMTLAASIRENNLILVPSRLSVGEHEVKVYLINNNGTEYNPAIWSFNVISNRDLNKILKLNGRLWNDYNGSETDNTNLYSNTTNLNFNLYYDWIDVKAKIKKSSLENKFDQAKDRYSLDINLNDLFRVNIGDFYPEFNPLTLHGNRVRGVGVRFNSDFVRLNIINGELARAIDGDPNNNAMTMSDYSFNHTCTQTAMNDNGTIWDPGLGDCVDSAGNPTVTTTDDGNQEICENDDFEECVTAYDPYYVDISRSNYAFKRKFQALRLEFGKKDRLTFAFNLLKAKDDVSSVNRNVPNSIVSLSSDVELLQIFNSDQFIDFNNDGLYNNEDIITIDYNGTGYSAAGELPSNTTGALVLIEESILCEDLVSGGYISQSQFENNLSATIVHHDPDCILACAGDITCESNCPIQCLDNNTEYSIRQSVWDVQVSYENLEDILVNSENYQILDNPNILCSDVTDLNGSSTEQDECEAISYCEWTGTTCIESTTTDIINQAQYVQSVNFESDQWEGNKPKDNVVIGSDFSFTSKNQKVKVKSSVAMSLYNDNTWNGAITMDQLDNLDGFEDCHAFRSYDFNLGSFSLNNYDDPLDLDPSNGIDKLDVKGCLEFSCENDVVNISKRNSPYCTTVFEDVVNQEALVSTQDELLEKINENYTSYISDQGTAITDLPDLEDYADEFIFTVDNLPLPNVIDKFMNGKESEIGIKDILNSPDVAYNVDAIFSLPKHHLNFGVKQVGQSFYSLANPYIQTNIREQYFKDRMRFLQNKLFLIFKWNNAISGFISDNKSTTKKIDLNVSYYPGINLPSFAANIGNYTRKSGEKNLGFINESGTWWLNNQCISDDNDTTWNSSYDNGDGTTGACLGSNGDPLLGIDESTCYADDILATIDNIAVNDISGCQSDDYTDGDYDNRIQTSTKNYNLSISHRLNLIYKHNISINYFKSDKKDELINERLYDKDGNLDSLYVSPKSSSYNINLSVLTDYDYRWESNFQFSRSYFDFGQTTSNYYQVQRMNSYSLGFAYKTDSLIDKIGANLNFSRGSGTNKYTQSGLKLFSKLILRENLDLNLNYNYRNKKIENLTDNTKSNFYNSAFKANLTYRF